MLTCMSTTLDVDSYVAVRVDPAIFHSNALLPIVPVHPLVVFKVRSEGMVRSIFPLLSLLGKVYTVVKITVKVHAMPAISQPLLLKDGLVKGFSVIATKFKKIEPISSVKVLEVIEKILPTSCVFSRIFIEIEIVVR